MVALHNRAWHAGRSYHPLVGNNVNSYSIGIELEGPPSYVGLSSTGWNTNQLNLLWELCILIKYKVPTIVGITDHSTILPTMKTDVLAGTGINKLSFDIWEAGIEYTKLENMSTKVIRDQIRAYFKLV
jgi:N-acetyl-anhydromuramyl-L-alanine amidase AmpD